MGRGRAAHELDGNPETGGYHVEQQDQCIANNAYHAQYLNREGFWCYRNNQNDKGGYK